MGRLRRCNRETNPKNYTYFCKEGLSKFARFVYTADKLDSVSAAAGPVRPTRPDRQGRVHREQSNEDPPWESVPDAQRLREFRDP